MQAAELHDGKFLKILWDENTMPIHPLVIYDYFPCASSRRRTVALKILWCWRAQLQMLVREQQMIFPFSSGSIRQQRTSISSPVLRSSLLIPGRGGSLLAFVARCFRADVAAVRAGRADPRAPTRSSQSICQYEVWR